ncbi:D-alanyl-D-alanine carboxypeptidase [Streptomyces sp. TRM 70361]|uniref:D-alanyl-D-alanine carboxypeptidase family protein n=1 Tax=Streptomyces sp. TRM 70361 TaxID=3116553 RepID=UPI002E7ABA19|nr:D-alanyl-D-alanine carboxypeptidase [Streptomyces sp. TRM 70361]MEE1939416.1 D-alanyl-D-alanine carboxypeptidase [Streptomyces sp. TRM 70361]
MSTTHPVIIRARRVRGARGLVAATPLLLLSCLFAGAPAAAAPSPAPADGPRQPSPPANMSTVGGERLGLPGVQIAPLAGAPALPKSTTSRAWIVADAETGDVLAAKNAHWPLAPASTIKMLFADTLLPKFDRDTVHKVAPEDLAELGPGSSLVGIKEDLTYTVHDLWLGVFLRSGNDAVHVLAAMNGGREKTVREMNEHARRLGATDTHVVSPDGYDAPGQVSSAYDLTLFARSGMQKPDFREYAATVRAEFPGLMKEDKKTGKAERETFEIQNTNRLLTGTPGLEPYKGLAGIKNGYTSKAGFTFTGVAERGDRVLLVTTMHPEEGGVRVYEEAAELLDWGFAAADRVEPVGELVAPQGARDGEGKNTDDGPGGEDAAVARPSGPTAAGAQPSSGGAGTALTTLAAVLAMLGAGAYGVYRRRPRPAAARPGRGPRRPAVLGSPENPGPAEPPRRTPDGLGGADGTTGTGRPGGPPRGS